MRNFCKALTLFILFGSVIAGHSAKAEDLLELEKFEPTSWSSGLHLIGGLGANLSMYKSETEPTFGGGGLNFNADVGYYFRDDLAVELSTIVMFNQVRGLLIWDTIGMLGVRYRLKDLDWGANRAHFVRAFVGPSVSVIIGDVPPESDIGGQRTHIQGVAGGFGFGGFQKAANGKIWYMEALAIAHDYRLVEAVDVDDEVPVVVNSREIHDSSRLYSVSVSFGVLAF